MAGRFLFPTFGLFLITLGLDAQEIREPISQGPPLNVSVDAQGDPLPAGALARFGTTRFRFGGMITAAALSPNGRWIAASNNGDMLTLSDPKTGKELKRLRLPEPTGVSFMTFSPDSQNIALMGYTPFLQIIAIPSGKLVTKVHMPQPNNNRLSNFAFSGNGKIIVAGTDNFGQNQNFIHAWDVPTGKPIHQFEVVQNAQIRGSLSQDGFILATSGFYHARNNVENNPDQRRTIQIWDLLSGKETRKIKIDENQVMATAVSPDGKTLAVASGAATFHLFEIASGKELRRFSGRRGPTQFLQFSPEGKTLVAGSVDGTVQLWEAATGKRMGQTDGPRQRLFSVAFPSPGQIWALGMEGQALSLWEVYSNQPLSPREGHMTGVRLLSFASDGKTLMSGGTDGKLCWWDVATAKELRHHRIRDEESFRNGGYPPGMFISNYALSPDGKYLAHTNDFGNNTIRLLDMTTGKVLSDFDVPRNNHPSAFAFSPDNSRLAAIGLKGVHVWDVTTGQELPSLPFKKMADPNGGMNGGTLVYSPDGKILAGARTHYDRNTGLPLGEVYLWNTEKGTEIACLERSGQFTATMSFSPNSQVLALPLADQSVMLIKAGTGRELGRLEGSQANFIQGMTFSPDGRLLAGAQQLNVVYSAYSPVQNGSMVNNQGNRIFIWELASSQIRQDFSGHQGTVSCLAFSPDGRSLATAGADTTVLLWDLVGKSNALSAQKIEAAWNELTDKNGRRVQELMIGMIQTPDATLEFFRKVLKPDRDTKGGPEEIQRLISLLDHESFSVRMKATTALEQLGDLANPALRKALLAKNSLEAERRLKNLVDRLDKATLPPDELRRVRAVEVLEKIATPQARALLAQLAAGVPQSRLTLEAAAALRRLQ